MIKTPNLAIAWYRRVAKYIHESINLVFYVSLNADEWPWPIEFSAGELERILNGFNDEELMEFVAGEIDGDGMVWYKETAYVGVVACKACSKRFILDVLKRVIAERFGIVGSIESEKTTDTLKFSGKDAVKLLRRITKHVHHPLRRLRAELILMLYDGRISPEEFERLYEQTKYERGEPDIKHSHALEATIQTAPQTHTHGDLPKLQLTN
jgi:hypothetical protein